jgi:hypothetical protein
VLAVGRLRLVSLDADTPLAGQAADFPPL